MINKWIEKWKAKINHWQNWWRMKRFIKPLSMYWYDQFGISKWTRFKLTKFYQWPKYLFYELPIYIFWEIPQQLFWQTLKILYILWQNIVDGFVWCFWIFPTTLIKDIIYLTKKTFWFIKNLPTLPQRTYFRTKYLFHKWTTNTLKYFTDLFIRQNYLRKKLLKNQLLYTLGYIFVFYFILSLIAEIRLYTDHEFAQWNVWWDRIYYNGYLLIFSYVVYSVIVLLLTTYFVSWLSFWKSWRFYLITYTALTLDLFWTWLFAETVNVIVCTVPFTLLHYILSSIISWEINEWSIVKLDAEDVKPIYAVYYYNSWQTYHFYYKFRDEPNKKLKNYYKKKFHEWRIHDYSKRFWIEEM